MHGCAAAEDDNGKKSHINLMVCSDDFSCLGQPWNRLNTERLLLRWTHPYVHTHTHTQRPKTSIPCFVPWGSHYISGAWKWLSLHSPPFRPSLCDTRRQHSMSGLIKDTNSLPPSAPAFPCCARLVSWWVCFFRHAHRLSQSYKPTTLAFTFDWKQCEQKL